jgi:two-component system, chemotaxis family, sensor kinase CheA
VADEGHFTGFLDDYFVECEEHLTAIRGLLLVLDAGIGVQPVRPEVLDELFRTFHSIKGISGMVELREAEMLAHHMESYLRVLRRREAQLDANGMDALIRGVDALEQTIAAHRERTAPPSIEQAVRDLSAVLPAAGAANPATLAIADAAPVPAASWRVTFVPSPGLLARGVNVDSVRARLRGAGTIVDATPKVTPEGIAFIFLVAGAIDAATADDWASDGIVVEAVAPAMPAALPGANDDAADLPPAEPSARVAAAHVVRVDLARLDEVMRMIGDLVISRACLDAATAPAEALLPPAVWRPIQENTQTIERQLRDLREGVMRLRLVPVGEIFRRMPFVVRDLARESGTKVRLELRGQDTEIDKFLIERMMDPVLHLVRNAVSHGFERPAARLAAGKPEEGTLMLAAASVGESVVLEIADDGRGIDAAAVAARARALGFTLPEGPIDAATLLDVLCAPGFSTRDETDRASGRGVGMGVVKTTVEELNGTMTLQTAPGEGTRFVIELPLTLSIADALIAHVGDRVYAVPQSAVREVVEIEPAAIRQIEGHEIAPFRGGSLPILRLSRLFGVTERPRRALHVFVVGSGVDAVGIAVDRIAGQREIVVRGMADALVKVEGVSGATDLGDGRVVLILDLAALARRARSRIGRLEPAP